MNQLAEPKWVSWFIAPRSRFRIKADDLAIPGPNDNRPRLYLCGEGAVDGGVPLPGKPSVAGWNEAPPPLSEGEVKGNDMPKSTFRRVAGGVMIGPTEACLPPCRGLASGIVWQALSDRHSASGNRAGRITNDLTT